jgi:preprotein translocase subunit SecG
MDIWLIAILVVHVVAALGIIGLVLLQHGKGADMGAAFGSGSSGSLFGATGSANFLSRTTSVLAAIFFATSLGLAYVATHRPKADGGVMDAVKDQPVAPLPSATSQPAAPAADSAAKSGDAGTSKANEVPK